MDKPRILIVDDDENIAELISLYLNKECFDTEIAGDSLRARLEPDGPDLAFLGPPPPGTNELGAPAWTAPFVAVFSATDA